jgi:hypothetical protein
MSGAKFPAKNKFIFIFKIFLSLYHLIGRNLFPACEKIISHSPLALRSEISRELTISFPEPVILGKEREALG